MKITPEEIHELVQGTHRQVRFLNDEISAFLDRAGRTTNRSDKKMFNDHIKALEKRKDILYSITTKLLDIQRTMTIIKEGQQK